MTILTRFTTLAIAAIAAITLSSTPAFAQPYIEIDVSGSMQGQTTGYEFKRFGLRAIFDAGAAPVSVGNNSIRFDGVWGEAFETKGLPSIATGSPIVIDTALEYIPADFDFIYVRSSNSYRISADVNGEYMDFVVIDPIGSFSLAMTTLPDDLGDYQVFSNGPVKYDSYSSINGDIGSARWEGGSGGLITGSIHATFRYVDGPPEPECLADVNGDGELNFFDISAYIALFSAGCP